jgi:Glycosyl hydrolases family 39.
MNSFIIDANAATTYFPHVWEECVGSCHAATALRADWQEQMKKCRKELGFKSVRFHGIFNDDMSVYGMTGNGPCYSFHNVDLIYDFLLDIDMKPFVELSFMPGALASGTQTAFHYRANVTPPSDYNRWADLIEKFAQHLVDRYGIDEVSRWYFEVWNEPESNYFWAGGKEEYFRLYRYTAEALKRVDTRLRVGGPATGAEKWIDDMIAFCEGNGVPLDFISTHHYPTDVGIGFGHPMEERMAKSKRGVLKEKAMAVRKKAGKYPLFYTEWSNSPGNRDVYHDMPYAAAFAVKTLADNQGLTDIYSYFAFSDIFEEMQTSSLPFHGSFGLLNIYGVPKPVYRAFQILHEAGTERLPVEGGESRTLEALALKKGTEKLDIILHNHNIPLSPIKEETACVTVKGINKFRRAVIRRVDENHCNPRRVWIDMGSPEYPEKEEIRKLLDASELKDEPINCENKEGSIMFTVTVPPHGIADIILEL